MLLAADLLEILEVHPTPHLGVGQNGDVVFVNPAAMLLLGARARQALGAPWHALLSQSERDRAVASTLPSTGQWVFSDGDDRAIECRVTTLPAGISDGAGCLVALTGAGSSKDADAALWRQELSYRQIAGNVPAALLQYVLFPDGTDAVQSISAGCIDLWELEPDEAEQDASRLWTMVDAADLVGMQQSILRSSERVEPWFHEWKITTPSGKHKWLQGSGQPIPRSDGSTLWHTVVVDVTERKHLEEDQAERIRQSREQLRSLAVRVQDIREEERKDLARELHDQVSQYLTVMGMDLHQIGVQCEVGDDPGPSIEHMSEMLDATLDAVQRLASRLRPSMLDVRGLGPAIISHANKLLNSEGGATFHVEIDEGDSVTRDLDSDLALAAFRVFQESTTNVLRHAGASEAWIRLAVRDGNLLLEVEDDGVGITLEELDGRTCLGLIGMRERMHALGGTFSATPAPGGGTIVRATAPLTEGSKS